MSTLSFDLGIVHLGHSSTEGLHLALSAMNIRNKRLQTFVARRALKSKLDQNFGKSNI